MISDNLPLQFFKDLSEDIDYPLAAVSIDNKFIWINSAFEKLVGYSMAELVGKTWMSITNQKYVGGDLAGVQSILDGDRKEYQMDMKYVHRRGHDIPVELTVWRWPTSMAEPVFCFRVSACPTKATPPELNAVHKELLNMINDMQNKIDTIDDKGKVTVNTNVGDQVSAGGNVHQGDNNSMVMIKVLGGVLIVVTFALMYLGYIVANLNTKTVPEPPTIPQIQPME